jgi:lysophospholipase L1-like esterase
MAAESDGRQRTGPGGQQLVRRLATAAIAAAALVAGAAVIAGCAGPATPARTTAERSSTARPDRPAGPAYYLSLGDSLAQGVQPDAAGQSRPTSRGYADQLYATLRRHDPGLRLVKLGCSGETSWTMIRGSLCRYPAGSQLAAARQFLRAHRGHVALVTIDIGANDPNSCYLGAPLRRLPSCMASRLRLTVADLRTILSGVRAAAGPAVPVVGMNYYVPELAGWLHGKTGKEVAVLTERLVNGYNLLLAHEYRAYGVQVADVFAAFHSSDFTDRVKLPQIGTVPRSVATICKLTWACAQAPYGPNEHANDVGYAIMAAAFLVIVQR